MDYELADIYIYTMHLSGADAGTYCDPSGMRSFILLSLSGAEGGSPDRCSARAYSTDCLCIPHYHHLRTPDSEPFSLRCDWSKTTSSAAG